MVFLLGVCVIIGLIVAATTVIMAVSEKLRGETEYEKIIKAALERLGPDLSSDPDLRWWEKKALRRLASTYYDITPWGPSFIEREIHIDAIRRRARDLINEAGLSVPEGYGPQEDD